MGQKAGENEKRADATQGIGSLFISLSNELGNKQNETFPSLRLGGSNPSHLPFIRKGLNPNPRPFPSPGEGMQPLASARSVTKVSATHQRVAGRLLTQQSCDCFVRASPAILPKSYSMPPAQFYYLIAAVSSTAHKM